MAGLNRSRLWVNGSFGAASGFSASVGKLRTAPIARTSGDPQMGRLFYSLKDTALIDLNVSSSLPAANFIEGLLKINDAATVLLAIGFGLVL